jgi:hypothetical protein
MVKVKGAGSVASSSAKLTSSANGPKLGAARSPPGRRSMNSECGPNLFTNVIL